MIELEYFLPAHFLSKLFHGLNPIIDRGTELLHTLLLLIRAITSMLLMRSLLNLRIGEVNC